MNAQTLGELVKVYTGQSEVAADPMVDGLTIRFLSDLFEDLKEHGGKKYKDAEYVGISICYANLDRKIIDFGVGDRIIYVCDYSTPEKLFGMVRFYDYVRLSKKQRPCHSVACNSDDNVEKLGYLVTQLEDRDFECYVDPLSGDLVVFFKMF